MTELRVGIRFIIRVWAMCALTGRRGNNWGERHRAKRSKRDIGTSKGISVEE